jgi:DNA-binding CsgD family transcriptional regulator
MVSEDDLEARVRWLAANGRSPREIAAELGISRTRTRQLLGHYLAYQRVRTFHKEGA